MATTLSIDVVALDKASTTFVKMAAQVERLSEKLDKIDGRNVSASVAADTGKANSDLALTDAALRRLDGRKAKVKVDVDKSLTDTINGVARLGSSLGALAMPGAMVAAVPMLLNLANVAVATSGSLGVLAGGLAAVGVVAGTVKLGTKGMGDAFKAVAEGDAKKLDEAMAKLAPNAQATVREWQALKPAMDGMQLGVQDALFRNLGTTLRSLADAYLPTVREGFTNTAAGMNAAAQETARYLAQAESVGKTKTIFDNTSASVGNLGTVGASLSSIFLNIASVGSTFLPGLASGFAAAAENGAAFVQRMAETGNLTQWMQTGLDTLRQLGEVAGNVGSILWSAMAAAADAGGGFLGNLVTITGQLDNLLQTAQGYTFMVNIFTAIHVVVGALAQIIVALAPTFAALAVQVAALASVLATALVPIAAALQPLLTVVANVLGSVLVTAVQAVTPIILLLAQVLTATLVPILEQLTPVVNEVVTILGGALLTVVAALAPAIGPLVGALQGVLAAVLPLLPMIAAFAATLIAQLAPILPQIVGLVTQLVIALTPLLPPLVQLIGAILPIVVSLFGSLVPVLASVVSTLVSALVPVIANVVVPLLNLLVGVVGAVLVPVLNVLGAVVGVIFQGIGVVINVVITVVLGLFSGLGAAVTGVGNFFTWLGGIAAAVWSGIQVATEVVGAALGVVFSAIGTAVTAVGTVLSWLWTSVVQPVFSFIAEAAKILLAVVVTIVLTPIMIAVNLLGPVVMGLWTNYVQPAFQAIGDFVMAIWNGFILPVFNAIVGFINGALAAAWNAASALVQAVWSAIQTAITTAWNFVLGVLTAAVNWLAMVFTTAWNALSAAVSAVWTAIQTAISAVWNWLLANVFNPIINFFVANLQPAFTALQTIVSTVWQTIQNVLGDGWNWIKSNVFDPIVNFVTQTIPNGFQTAVDMVGRVWDGIKQATRAPIQAVIDVVYNNGIVAAWNKIAGFLNIGGLEPFTLPAYAQGGPVLGGIPNKDSVPLMAMGGEYVLSKRAVDRAGGVDQVDAWHQALKAGRGGSLGHSPGYTMYGGDTSSPGLAYGRVGMQAGGAVDAALAYARAQNGKAYQWGGVGNPSFDCSGFMSAIQSVLMGQPVRRLYTTASFAGGGAAGMQRGTASQFVIGVEQGNPGHMAGNLAGVPVESNGSGVTVGRGRSPMAFPTQFFLPQVGGTFSDVGGGGIGISPLDWLKDLVGFMLDTPDKLAGGFGLADMTKSYGSKGVDSTWDWFLEKVTAMWSTIWGAVSNFFGGGAASGPIVDIVRSAATAYGWDQGPQWDAIDWIVSKESSWDPTAQNPTSSAYGLFQFVDKTWATVGSARSSSPQVQAAAGMRYIASSYDTPVGAKAFHQANGYYANGAVFNRPTFGLLGEAGPEVLLPINRPDRAESLARQAGIIPSSVTDGAGSSGVEERLDRLVDLIERRGAAATINVQDVSGDPAETARRTVLALRLA